MEINYVTVIVAGVLSMIIGAMWYGPIFGKTWMKICGVADMNEATRRQKQREAMPLYGIQFALSLLQIYILGNLFVWTGHGGVGVAIWMWLGFVMPTIAGCSMWNNNTTRVKWSMFLIQAGYQFVMFILYGYMLNIWS